MSVLAAKQQSVADAVTNLASSEQQQGLFDTVKRIFDPIGITGSASTGAVNAAQTMVDYEKETLDRAERERARLQSQLEIAVTALQGAVDKLSNAVKEHYDRVAEIDRLRVHVKENILYYMQAIWRQEPPDQRFFRLYDLDVPIVTADANVPIDVAFGNPGARTAREVVDLLRGRDTVTISLPMPQVTITRKSCPRSPTWTTCSATRATTWFSRSRNNYITLHMMQDYLEVDDELLIRDPDDYGDFTVDELRKLATCVNQNAPDTFNNLRDDFRQVLIDRLRRREARARP